MNTFLVLLIFYCLITYCYVAGVMYLKKNFDFFKFLLAPVVFVCDIIDDILIDFKKDELYLNTLFTKIIKYYDCNDFQNMIKIYESLSLEERVQFESYCTENHIVYKLKGIIQLIYYAK